MMLMKVWLYVDGPFPRAKHYILASAYRTGTLRAYDTWYDAWYEAYALTKYNAQARTQYIYSATTRISWSS